MISAPNASSFHDRVKVVYLEPQQDTVPRRRRLRVDEVRVVFLVGRDECSQRASTAEDRTARQWGNQRLHVKSPALCHHSVRAVGGWRCYEFRLRVDLVSRSSGERC